MNAKRKGSRNSKNYSEKGDKAPVARKRQGKEYKTKDMATNCPGATWAFLVTTGNKTLGILTASKQGPRITNNF